MQGRSGIGEIEGEGVLGGVGGGAAVWWWWWARTAGGQEPGLTLLSPGDAAFPSDVMGRQRCAASWRRRAGFFQSVLPCCSPFLCV